VKFPVKEACESSSLATLIMLLSVRGDDGGIVKCVELPEFRPGGDGEDHLAAVPTGVEGVRFGIG
jgi:hypothetical protein